MRSVASAIQERLNAGFAPTLRDIGGEAAILSCAHEVAASPYFGDVVVALAPSWQTLNDADGIYSLVAQGIRQNPDRLVLSQALDTITETPPADLRPILKALDARTRDEQSSPITRLESAAALLRFALVDEQWHHMATSTLQILEDVQDAFAGAMLCKLAGLCWNRFRDAQCIEILERRSRNPETGGQAALERGLIAIGSALERPNISGVIEALHEAAHWFRLATEIDDDARSARIYERLIQILVIFGNGGIVSKTDVAALKDDVMLHHIWDAPAPGFEWMFAPAEYRLQWVTMLDALAIVSGKLSRPSWLDAAATLHRVLQVYQAERSITFPFKHVERIIEPTIEAAFLREAGLLAHLDDWLEAFGETEIGAEDAATLRKNIQRRVDEGSPGKAPGVVPRGRSRLPKNSPRA